MVLVNLIKLTKLERKVLAALSESNLQEDEKWGYYPSEGSNVEGIAKRVYGGEVLGCEKRGGHICIARAITWLKAVPERRQSFLDNLVAHHKRSRAANKNRTRVRNSN